LDIAASREQVSTVCRVEADGIRERDASSGAPCARPFLDGGCQRHSEFRGSALAVAKDVEVPAGRLAGIGETIDEPNGHLLADHLGLVHAGEAAGSSSAALLPCEGELPVSIFSVNRVDPDLGRTCSYFHDCTASFAFLGHRTRLPRQLVWNCVWKTCRGFR